MKENPCRPPIAHTDCDDDGEQTLIESMRAPRKAQRRWSHRCWLFGLVGIVFGVAGLKLLQLLHIDRSADWLATVAGGVAIDVIVIGCGLIVFGPISWFWIRNGR